MTIAIFASCAFFLRIKKLTILEKNKLKRCIKENGGQIAFGLNQECTHVVTDDADALSPSHLKTIQKYELPVVNVDFIWDSIKERRLLQLENYELSQTVPCETGMETTLMNEDDSPKEKGVSEENNNHEWDNSRNTEKLRWFSDNNENIPYFPKEFEVAKYDVLEKITAHGEYVVVEIQCFQQQCCYPFCVSAHYSMLEGLPKQKRLMPTKTSEEARKIYALCIQDLKKMGFELRKDFPYQAEYLASEKLQEVLIADTVNSSVLSKEVGRLVELIWTEAVGHLNDLLDKPITRISFNDVSRAEGILRQAKEALDETKSPTELSTIISEFYKIIPHKNILDYDVSKKLLSNKRDLCQLIRDMLNIYEINMSVPNSSSLSKYRALRCRIDALNVESEEFHNVKQLLDQNTSENPIQVLQIYKVSRITERMVFEGNLGNIQSLFHASSACNFVGILSRGLLLPKMVVEDYGLERTDIGYLGSGIYFSNSIRTSIKYSQPCETDGTRLLVICDVALGTCWETESHNCYSTEAPLGYDSVHGVSRTTNESSVFEDDEFVVYRTSQMKIKYVVQFSCVNDKVKEFQPIIQTELEDQMLSLEHHDQPKDYSIPSRDLLNDISAGLMDRAGNPIPLKDIRIKGRIIDFVAEVVVFQTYENETRDPIEAKYVFPLDDTAAVCGFEAFIKGKHIIGEVKEKEKAHQEYREAISRGDGAYLMDQDAPDIFTVSVGNLPPSTKVLIKISYITELSYEKGNLCFHLPAAVAPWQQDKALNENTQDSVRKICIRQTETKREFSLEMSIEMPFKINNISSWTHQLKIKKTDCKAVVCTTEGSFLDTSGFAMEILIGDVYLPRMWVEKHPDEDSEACMLVFQPEFEDPFDLLSLHGEAVICLDCSNSMAGSAIQQAKEIALHALNSCHLTRKISVIKFGTNFVEFFPNLDGSPMDPTALKEFITSATATMGDSHLWKALHYLSLLYPAESKRNVILISDGHIQNEGLTLQTVKKNATHTRIFTCAVGPTANRHMLRSLAQYGAGAFEYFDVKSKYNWERKMESQATRMFSPRCSSISIEWQNYDIEKPELTYAPAQIQSLFNHERLLVYGFILNCTQAILNALVDRQELRALVSTTELQKTTGTMLHKLAARAFIRDYEQGMLDENETEHEMKKQQLKSFIIELSLKNSIVTQFTSFVAIEKREADEDRSADTLNVLEPVAKEDVDILPYMEYSTELDDTSMLEDDFLLEGDFLESASYEQEDDLLLDGDFLESASYEQEDDLLLECDFPEFASHEVLGVCATNAMDVHSQNDTFDSDTQVQVSTQISPKTYSGSFFSYPPQPSDLNQLTLQSKCQSHQKLSSDLLEMPRVSLRRSSRKEIAFEKPEGALVNKTVFLTKKKIIPQHQPAFHSEVEISNIFVPEKKVKRSAFHKRKITASEMRLKTTHHGAKSSEEYSHKDTYPRSFRTPLSSVDWPQLFMLQNQDGFWQLTSALGILLNLDVHHLIHVSLAKKGIQSLGPKGKEKLLQLIATLLVLQAIYFKQLEGLIFKSLMKLKDSPPSWALNPVRKATEWANRTSREFPGICQCLELGKDWDDATKKLLGI